MATDIIGSTIATTYHRMVLRENGNTIGAGTDTVNIEIQEEISDGANAFATPLYLSTNRIGIGTASPESENDGAGTVLHIGCSAGENQAIINLTGGILGNNKYAGQIQWSLFANTDLRMASIASAQQGTTSSSTNAGGSLEFFTKKDNGSLTQAMHIDENQNVGIGVADPDNKLEVVGTAYAWVGDNSNTVFGKGAGANCHASGANNTFIGYLCGDDTHTSATDNNVGVGTLALSVMTSGSENVAVGVQAGVALTEGIQNVFIGNAAGDSQATSDGNTCLGYATDCAEGVSNQLAIGRASTVSAQYGIAIGDNVTSGTNIITVGKSGTGNNWWLGFTTGTTWAQSSDLRMKRNIKDDTLGLSFINDLKTKTFQWKPSEEFPVEWEDWNLDDDGNKVYADVYDGVMHGMIAQDVKEALDKAGVDTFGAWAENEKGAQSLASGDFVYPLIKAVQELSAKVTALENA